MKNIQVSKRIIKLDGILAFDTSRKAAKIQYDVFRNLGREQKFSMTVALSNNLQCISKSGIQQRHPEYTPQQVVQAYLKLILEKPFFNRIFSGKMNG